MSLVSFIYQEQIIQQREDGFINLTQMCQANGKRLKDFLDHPRTLKTIHCLYAIQTGNIRHVIEVVNGDTWGHFQLAAEMAYQSDASFAVWFNQAFYNVNILTHQDSISLAGYDEWKSKYFTWESDKSNDKAKNGVVYFILNQTKKILKIGFTGGDPQTRLSSFKSGAVGESLVLLGAVPGTLETESMYHLYLSNFKVQGEWFRYTDEVIAFVEQTIAKCD